MSRIQIKMMIGNKTIMECNNYDARGCIEGTEPYKDYANTKDAYSDLVIFVPGFNEIIMIAEGNGDNILEEDREEGYVDYIYFEQYGLETGMPEVGGGLIMIEKLFREEYSNTYECVPDVLEMAYGNKETIWIELGRGE